MNKKCICQDELMLSRPTIVHLAWCPESYFYKEFVEEYIKAPWYKKLFMRDPRKYYNFLI